MLRCVATIKVVTTMDLKKIWNADSSKPEFYTEGLTDRWCGEFMDVCEEITPMNFHNIENLTRWLHNDRILGDDQLDEDDVTRKALQLLPDGVRQELEDMAWRYEAKCIATRNLLHMVNELMTDQQKRELEKLFENF